MNGEDKCTTLMGKPKAQNEPKIYRQPTIVTGDLLYETIVMNDLPYYAVFNRQTQEVSYEENVEIQGRLTVPFFHEEHLGNIVKFASGADAYGSELELLEEIRAYIRRWCVMEDKYLWLASSYVLLTYCYDSFFTIPYLRILADLGSGKSRLGVELLGNICYRAISTAAASTMAPIFRTINDLGCSLILDEADLGDKSDKTNELVQICNMGYMSGGCVSRCELLGGRQTAVNYKVFGPKVLISREVFRDDALESRCLAIRLTASSDLGRRIVTVRALADEGAALRNKLLMWRFHNFKKREDDLDWSFVDKPADGSESRVPPRLKGLLAILGSIVKDIPDAHKALELIAEEQYSSFLAGRKDTVEGELAQLVADCPAGSFVTCGDLSVQFNLDKNKNEEKSAKSIGWYLRVRLFIQTEESRAHNGARGIKVTEEIVENMKKRFGVTPRPKTESWPPLQDALKNLHF